jgi:hypothetical protein
MDEQLGPLSTRRGVKRLACDVAPQLGEVEGRVRIRGLYPYAVVTCEGRPPNLLSRVIAGLRFRRSLRRCGDFLLEDPPPDSFVRQPLRPRPLAPGGAIALDLPEFDT